jgi:hypothetical protein
MSQQKLMAAPYKVTRETFWYIEAQFRPLRK